MNKSDLIKHIYAIFIGVFAVALGIAIICVAADIYYSIGEYTREIVGDRLLKLSIPCVLFIAAVIVGVIFPIAKYRVKPNVDDALGKLLHRMPTDGEGEEFSSARVEYLKLRKIRLIVWLVGMALVLAAAIVVLWYLIDTSHFSMDATASMLALVRVVMPVTAAAFAVMAGVTVTGGIAAKKQLAALKTMIKTGNGERIGNTRPAFIGAAENVLGSNITLWVVRGVIFALAVTFIILGIFNGGANDVLVKAINICSECIGLG